MKHLFISGARRMCSTLPAHAANYKENMSTSDEFKPVVEVEAEVPKVAEEEKAEGAEEETTSKTEDKTAAVDDTTDEKKGDEVQEESTSVLGRRKSTEPATDGEAPEKGEEGKAKAAEGEEPPAKTAKTTDAEEAPVAEPTEA